MAKNTPTEKAPEPQEAVIQVTGSGSKTVKGKGKVQTDIAFPLVRSSSLQAVLDQGPTPWVELVTQEKSWGTPYRLVAKLHTYVPVWNGNHWVQIPQAHDLWSWDTWGRGLKLTKDAWTVHPYDSHHKKRRALSAALPLDEALGLIEYLREDRGGEYWIFPAS